MDVNFLVLILYYRDARCYFWERLGDRCKRPLCTYLCNDLCIYNYVNKAC